jgi:lipoprotein-releasing system permease protein
MRAMNSLLPFYIGLRYTWAKRRNTFISFVSLFAFIGMALGVFALIVVLSVMNGFDRELKDRILRVVPHGFVEADKPLQDWPALVERVMTGHGVQGAAPYVAGHGLVTYDGSVHGVEIQGIDPQAERSVSVVHQHMLVGDLEDLQAGEYQIVLGSLLARYLSVTIGDKVQITLPDVSVTPAGIFPRTKRFTVVGVFEVGAQLDQSLALVHIADAQKLLRRQGGVDGLRLRFNDIYKAPALLNDLQRDLGPQYKTRDWSETQGSLFQAIKMEKTVVGIMLGIIIAVAAFNIVTSLIMMITEKRADIAVLRTMGMSAGGVVGIFMVQGTVIGLVGILIGTSLGILVALNLATMVTAVEQTMGAQIFDPTVYFVTTMPSQLLWADVIWVCSGAALISFLVTCYPAWRASQIAPAEALRYNV